MGFEVCDEAENGIWLWYLSFAEDAETSKFKECAKYPRVSERGCSVLHQPVSVLCEICSDDRKDGKRTGGFVQGNPFVQRKDDVQNAPTPITTYALFFDGKYVTNEQMNDKRFLKLLS